MAIESQLLGGSGSLGYTLYQARYWILFQLSSLSFLQCLFWISFSPISGNAKLYYGVDDATIAWWMNVGVVAGLLCQPLATWLAAQEGGLKSTCVVTALVTALAMCARLLPSLLHQEKEPWAVYVIYAAQFVVGLCGPAVMGTPPMMSAQWFGAEERTKATAVAVLSNNFGAAAGFLLGPALVAIPEQVPRLLWAHAACAVLSLLCVLAYFPSAPPTPPSPAAKQKSTGSAADDFSIEAIKSVLRNPQLLLIALGGGAVNGVYNVWSGSFNQILGGQKGFDQTVCGWLGFATTLAVIFGGVLMGAIADTAPWNRRMKGMLLGISLITSLFFAVASLALQLPPAISTAPLLTLGFWPICIAITLSGGALGLMIPLFYELGAEVTYPANEAISANIIVFTLNLSAFLFLFALGPLLKQQVLNLVMLGASVVAVLLFVVLKPVYRRAEAESRDRGHVN